MIKTFKRDDGARIFHTKQRFTVDAFLWVAFGGEAYRFCLYLGKLSISIDR